MAEACDSATIAARLPGAAKVSPASRRRLPELIDATSGKVVGLSPFPD